MNWATKDMFFKAKPPIEELDIEGIGKIKIQGLELGERDEYESQGFVFDAETGKLSSDSARAVLIQKCARDQHGNKLFAENDIGKINTIPSAIAEKIYNKARELSGMVDKKKLKDKVKNSEPQQTKDSVTD